jgi:N-dimethylarginine dimethylaminohydrolase
MKLNIADEFSPLKKVAVCLGTDVPDFDTYTTNDPQETKWGLKKWDKELLLRQQHDFFDRLSKYDVELVLLDTAPQLFWQMFTRDTGFVLGDTFYYSEKRTLQARHGEIEKFLAKVQPEKVQKIENKIEGGDVLAGETCLVGLSNRTEQSGFDELAKYVKAKSLFLGDDVMHLDTRLTLLPNGVALAYLEAFTGADQEFLTQTYQVIAVTKEEIAYLGTNVFVVNPETIFVEAAQTRIQDELKQAGFNVESVAYSEPIALDGAFRCTTLPLVRES